MSGAADDADDSGPKREMQPDEWQHAAESFVRSTTDRIDALERGIDEVATGGSFRTLWEHVREIGDSIRMAPAISGPDKVELQRRLSGLVRRLRDEQRRFHQEVELTRDLLHENLRLVADAVREAGDVEALMAARADLSLLRERVTSLPAGYPRSIRTALWDSWQATNRAAWEGLLALWAENERLLAGMLDEAEHLLDRESPRQARDAIKAFHEATTSHECSHREAKALRARANALWRRSVELGQSRHEQFLASLQRRVQRWRRELETIDRQQAQLKENLPALEQNVERAATGVGHALARGQVAEAVKEIDRLTVRSLALQREIRRAEDLLAADATGER